MKLHERMPTETQVLSYFETNHICSSCCTVASCQFEDNIPADLALQQAQLRKELKKVGFLWIRLSFTFIYMQCYMQCSMLGRLVGGR